MNKFAIKARLYTSNSYVYPGKSSTVYPNLILNKNIKLFDDIYFSDIFEFKLADNTSVYGCFVLKHQTRQIAAILFDY